MINKYPTFNHFVSVLVLILGTMSPAFGQNIVLENDAGVKMVIPKTSDGYSFGSLYLNGKAVERSLLKGMIKVKNTENNTDIWLYASEASQMSDAEWKFSGKGSINDATITFSLIIEIPDNIPAINLIYDFKVDKDIENRQACLLFNADFDYDWKCHIYPWAADARSVQRDPLSWVGIPSLIMYRDDMSSGLMWGIDHNSDYLNPKTWTKDCGLYFINGRVPAQYRFGGKTLQKDIEYHCPMQLILTDKNDPDLLITDLVQSWMMLTEYKVDELSVRSNDQALKLFIHGRKHTSMWYPGQGYRLEMGDPSSAFIYIGEQGLSALFDYMLFEMTGDAEWRQRAFQQMEFILTGQNNTPEDPLYGYIHTAFSLVDYGPAGKGFNSYDRGSNQGYKVDINVYLGRYMLHMWERVKTHEGIDRQDWYNAAIKAIDWAVSQQNSDGGFPQKLSFVPLEQREDNDWMGTAQPEYVTYDGPGEKSISATSGRALPALWHIYRITGDEKYKRILSEVEAYNLASFQNKLLFNSHHPDLPPHTLEEAAIWGICEYWLYRYEESNDETFLKHAIANAHLSLTWKCPKQLSWVDNPTQLGSAEQQYFLQYSIYCYQNRQVECLSKLYDYTKNKLYKQLAERVTQNIFFTQLDKGDLMGATHERIADPWLARNDGDGPGFNTMGTIYMSEQSLDLFMQTVGLYRTGEYLCKDTEIINKSYPDGLVYYSADKRGRDMAELKIVPSKGYINTVVKSWAKNAKIWMVMNASEGNVTIKQTIGSLDAGKKYEVLLDGSKTGTYEADATGTINFSYTGDFSGEHTVELRI